VQSLYTKQLYKLNITIQILFMVLHADFWRIIAVLGDFQAWLVVIFLALMTCLVLPKSRRAKITFLLSMLVLSLIISTAIVELLKILAQVPRPCSGDADCPSTFSFPSGHATTAFVLATAVALSIKNFGFRLAFLVLAVLVSISRVALNYHTYADIIAGALIGIMIAYFVNLFYKRASSLKTFKTIIS